MRPPASASQNRTHDASKIRLSRYSDFFNRIGPSRHLLLCEPMSVLGGKAEIAPLRLFAKDATCVLDPHFVGDAGP
jgi:hypothetical protein